MEETNEHERVRVRTCNKKRIMESSEEDSYLPLISDEV